ncbi:MAG: ATP-binding cassette domain-containing protein [Leptospirillia bacterium]
MVTLTHPALEVARLAVGEAGPYTLSIAAGECVALMGASGSGKSRLLRAIADLDPHTGSVTLGEAAQADIAAPEWRKRVGLLPAEPRWWHDTPRPHFPAGEHPAITDLSELGLPDDVMDRAIAHLSSGERQRLALLRLLARTPEVLLLDEPTANLDPDSTARVEARIARYRTEQPAAVLWVGHDRAQLERIAGRVLAVTPGGLGDAP